VHSIDSPDAAAARPARKEGNLPPETVTIHFEGRPLDVRADTSVAVALWEAGIRALSTSPKYGRRRGLHCARGHCTSCLMRVDGVPNVRACLAPVRAGMRIERQDAGAFYAKPLQKSLEIGDALFPVGFYYKWFTRPAVLSRTFLKGLRPLTGVGRLPEPAAWETAAPPRARDLGEWDQIVVGGGFAGLQAALVGTGRVLLVDDHPEPGGQRWPALRAVAASAETRPERFPVLRGAHRRLEKLVADFGHRPDLDRCLETRAVAGYQPGALLLNGDGLLSTARTATLTWTAGALDALGLFPGNDLPGLVGPRALYRLLMRDGLDVREREVVVVGGGLDLWLSAALLHARGARVSIVPGESGWQTEVSAALDLRWPLHTGLELASASARGSQRLSLVFVPSRGREASPGSHVELACDLAVIARRGKPVYDILYQLGADLVLQPELGGYLPAGAAEGDPRGATVADLPGGVGLRLAGEAAGLRPAEFMTRGEEAASR
jgi:sarcosine oxidase subunit alpha